MRATGAVRHTKVPAGLGRIMKVECSLTVTGTVTADVSTTTTGGTATGGTAISAVIMIGTIVGAGIKIADSGRALRPARRQCLGSASEGEFRQMILPGAIFRTMERGLDGISGYLSINIFNSKWIAATI